MRTKLIYAALFMAAITALSGCGSNTDVDLSRMSGTVAYSEVYNMMSDPESYVGKTVKMRGTFDAYESEQTNKTYFSCIIPDATGCCAEGIEFEWAGSHSYPEDYPEINHYITVTGIFEGYEEDGVRYYHLADADVDF